MNSLLFLSYSHTHEFTSVCIFLLDLLHHVKMKQILAMFNNRLLLSFLIINPNLIRFFPLFIVHRTQFLWQSVNCIHCDGFFPFPINLGFNYLPYSWSLNTLLNIVFILYDDFFYWFHSVENKKINKIDIEIFCRAESFYSFV